MQGAGAKIVKLELGGKFRLICKQCKVKTKTIDSRPHEEGWTRRRLCEKCGDRFTTLESVYKPQRGANAHKKPHVQVIDPKPIPANNPQPKPKLNPDIKAAIKNITTTTSIKAKNAFDRANEARRKIEALRDLQSLKDDVDPY